MLFGNLATLTAAASAADAIRAAFAVYAQQEARHQEGELDAMGLGEARQQLLDDVADAKLQNLQDAGDAARAFLEIEAPALTALVTAKDAANRAFLGDITPLAEALRNTVVGSWEGYLTALNAAATERDASLNTALTSLTGTIISAEDSYRTAMLAAGQRHDKAVVSAAAGRDERFLDAMDAALDTSGNGVGLEFTAAEALAIREAVSRLRGVVGASATVATAAVNASATFLGKLAGHGTALSRVMNAGDGSKAHGADAPRSPRHGGNHGAQHGVLAAGGL